MISGVISRVTILITHIRGLVTPLITTHDPPIKPYSPVGDRGPQYSTLDSRILFYKNPKIRYPLIFEKLLIPLNPKP